MKRDAVGAERPRKRYRTRNWREYDRGLIARGDLTVWLSPDLAWQAPEGTGGGGRREGRRGARVRAGLYRPGCPDGLALAGSGLAGAGGHGAAGPAAGLQ